MLRLLFKVWRFALISGVGLTLDFVLFLAFIESGSSYFLANLVGASIAVAFVYFASVYRVFQYNGNFLLGLLLIYLLYQVVAVSAASAAVSHLAKSALSPALSKLAILPVTFSANYMFMWLLTQGNGQARNGSSGVTRERHSRG